MISWQRVVCFYRQAVKLKLLNFSFFFFIRQKILFESRSTGFNLTRPIQDSNVNDSCTFTTIIERKRSPSKRDLSIVSFSCLFYVVSSTPLFQLGLSSSSFSPLLALFFTVQLINLSTSLSTAPLSSPVCPLQ